MSAQTAGKSDRGEKVDFSHCLFFSTAALNRRLTEFAEEEFGKIGLAPSHGFVLLVTLKSPGVQPSEIARQLSFKPSTITRFLDRLEQMGLVERKLQGRTAQIFATARARKMEDSIRGAWKSLYQRYARSLGKELEQSLTEQIGQARLSLEH
ncbi:MAG: MarR family transcriptional regulator [Leptospiraceae bacterium]|nr:MarR family transcriptional regulator [Leptospiraceae bacterium]